MDFDIIATPSGLFSIAWLTALFLVSAKLPLGALSLPCIMVMTSLIYFYLIPVYIRSIGDQGLYGLYFRSLEWAHAAIFLYAAGAAAAFALQWRVLFMDPAKPRPKDDAMDKRRFAIVWAVALLGVAARVWLGRMNLGGGQDYEFATQPDNFAFIGQSLNMLVPLTLLLLIQQDFSKRSWIVFALVLLIFLQSGYRFRILLLLVATGASFVIIRGLKVRTAYALIGAVSSVAVMNIIGELRRHGRGLDISRVESVSSNSLMRFRGEAGIAYTLGSLADNALPPPMPFEPLMVAFSRLVPTFLWADKPSSTFAKYWLAGTTIPGAERAGIASSQQAEMLLQVGWLGLPFLSFLYFNIVLYGMGRAHRLTREARVAACALAPAFFGYYMQSRGYFFQILVDALFMFGPLFFIGAPRGESQPSPGAVYQMRPRGSEAAKPRAHR